MPAKQLDDKQLEHKRRLAQWMHENGYSTRTLAAKMGITHTGISYMTGGDRAVSDGFILLFMKVFGIEEANKLFDIAHDLPESTPMPSLT